MSNNLDCGISRKMVFSYVRQAVVNIHKRREKKPDHLIVNQIDLVQIMKCLIIRFYIISYK